MRMKIIALVFALVFIGCASNESISEPEKSIVLRDVAPDGEVMNQQIHEMCDTLSLLFAQVAAGRRSYSEETTCTGELYYEFLLVDTGLDSAKIEESEQKLLQMFTAVACTLPPIDDFSAYRFMFDNCMEEHASSR